MTEQKTVNTEQNLEALASLECDFDTQSSQLSLKAEFQLRLPDAILRLLIGLIVVGSAGTGLLVSHFPSVAPQLSPPAETQPRK
ncbi:MAG TPA: hypothetical protein IGS53_23215 [Leptolyngbyaceae cyanobacterium M33_DOE_097]|uniref:Uncharacterized protein n=1 Tax=Oscillatoriales cyanobacterium SpSt-418 TaxID=2282169 RepID=A0A7C3PGR7_9CYAN|nr:hypothetical protein [Leptolyngbyaceae cyanobacterium M33_DOE_097]